MFGKNTSNTRAERWESIKEMPLDNWCLCTAGEIGYVRKEPTNEPTAEDVLHWNTVYDSYIKRFGLSEVHKKYLETLRKKALLETEYVIKRTKFTITKIEIMEAKLEAMMKNAGHGMTTEQALIYLSKWVGYRLDPKQITALEYFTLLDEYGKANKKK